MWRFLILLLAFGCTKVEPIDFEPIDVPAIDYFEDSPKAVQSAIEPTITMYSATFFCGPCERWKAEKEQRFEDSGWKVEHGPLGMGDRWPWFHIRDADGREYTIQGYLTSEALEAARRNGGK